MIYPHQVGPIKSVDSRCLGTVANSSILHARCSGGRFPFLSSFSGSSQGRCGTASTLNGTLRKRFTTLYRLASLLVSAHSRRRGRTTGRRGARSQIRQHLRLGPEESPGQPPPSDSGDTKMTGYAGRATLARCSPLCTF